MQLRISLRKLRKALDELSSDTKINVCRALGIKASSRNSERVYLDLSAFDKETAETLAERLLSIVRLTANQQLILSSFLGNFDKDLGGICFTTAKELYDHLRHLDAGHNGSIANIAIKLGSRAYPAHANLTFNKGEYGEFFCLSVQFSIGMFPRTEQHTVTATYYTPPVVEQSESEKNPVNLLEWLGARGIVPLTKQIVENTAVRLEKISDIKQKVQMLCSGQAISLNYSWLGSSVDASHFGTISHPEKVITDNEFELDATPDEYRHFNPYFAPILPLLRVFSLRLKRYFLVDVADLQEYAYDHTAIERLVLPTKMHGLLSTIFSKKEELFSDVVSGKHGGMVIMANGKPGVGKTLTAEIMAEYTERPLYVMELGELGTNLASVEESLNKIFKRVSRWNALLLFDEADIFLHKRDENLERSAIVGIFLRLLDYFPGVMFLTTNRSDVIDHAVKSRVTIALDYPDLDEETRTRIWHVMFRMLNRNPQTLAELPKLEINGRQIRNLMRLAVSVHGKTVEPEQILQLSEFTAK